uniref:(California timema) hypothetical protein n=1 Tax=Timema californicum TaxID=61474 RepID=A0A7R9IVW0_TIMCA|nr:unnamed protein product [Timema californicum]
MVVSDESIRNIMGGMESTAGVRLHNHRRKLKQRFDIIKKLGQGTYGKVQLGINKETGQEVAIKTIKKAKIETEADLVRIRREIQIMSSVQHPNIIHIYEVFENREKMVLVMEYAAGGELYDYLSERKVLTEDEARRIFRQIATAVYYCHKIADFGLSNVFDDQRLLNTFCGSPLYASPEIVKGTPYHGPEVDCWSLGVLLYTLVYGAMPFDGSNFKRLVRQISNGDYFEPKKPSPASPLIRDMLNVTPARRADLEKICAHWWVNETYTESCLEVAEELANQTPVRLDLLLSLAPPPPRVGSDKLLVGSDQDEGDALLDNAVLPTRSQSAGSLMELDHPLSERKIREFEQLDKRRGSIGGESKDIPPKRKLEEGISTDDAAHGGAKRKDRSRRRDREKSSDRRQHRSSSRTKQAVDSADKTFSPKKETSKTKTDKDSDELMDVDVEPPILSSSETLKPSESKPDQQLDDKIVKDQTSSLVVTDVTENNEDVSKPVEVATEITPHATLKTPEKESIKTATSEKSTRKSVKVSKKSKTAPLDSSIPVLTAASESKDELSNKAKCNKVPEAEPKTEGHSESKQENKENTAVKVKKKNIIGAKSEGVIVSKEMGDEFTKRDLDSRQLSRDITVAPGHTTINVGTSNDETMNGIIDKDLSESKENVIPQEVVKTKKTIKTKKSKGDISLNKLGSPEKSPATNILEDHVSPTHQVERRRSSIFETAEKFNNLLSGANEPRSPTSEKPKKVFIPGVKVSDYKQAYERKSSISGPSVLERKSSFSGPAPSTPVKSSSSKKSLKPTSDISKSDLTILNNDPESNKESVDNSVQAKSLNNTQNSEVKSSSKSTILKNDKKDENKASNLKTLTQRSENLNGTVNEEKGGHTKEIVDEEDSDLKLVPALPVKDKSVGQEQARIKKLKDAVEIIGNAITEENKRESSVDSSRKVSSGKPPVPNDSKIKSKVGGNGALSPKSPPTSPIDHALGKKTVRVQVGPNDIRLATVQVGSPESTKVPFVDTKRTLLAEVPVNEVQTSIDEDAEIKAEGQSVIDENITEDGKTSEQPTKKKTAKVEITLKSATLPRRKTSKAEIQIGYPSNQVPKVQFHTEVAHMVGGATLPMMPTKLKTQRSEVAFPVAAALPPEHHRSASLEPEGTIANKPKPREHIIPIQFEREGEKERPQVSSPPPGQARPPVPPLQQQKSQRGSLSRQSTADSDTESTISAGPELIRKSPREFIIPIAVEGGGYITPRASSLEPSVSETSTEQSNKFPTRTSGRFSRPRRMSSLLSESGASEDEVFNSISSPFATLQRHSSLTRDSDNPDDDKPLHHMHRLRSSRPSRHPLEHNDSLSSAEEEEDDDDGFEILTAESLFSTLLSRVRSLTQRLNVEDGGRPGFPSSRLMSHLASTANPTASSFFSNVYGDHPTSREADLSSAPWRRSVSRDATDADSMQSETANTMKGPTPRGSPRSDYGGNDDAANELSDSTSHSYTPSLSKRLHRQYQDSGSSSSHRDYLPPTRKSLLDSQNSDTSPSRRLSRTLSMMSGSENRSHSGTRTFDYVPSSQRSFNLLESKDSIPPSSSRYSTFSDAGDHSYKHDYDYAPLTRRTLDILENRNKDRLSSAYRRSSAASDYGNYYSSYSNQRIAEGNKVLPPLPYVSSHRRTESRKNGSLYTRESSTDNGSLLDSLNQRIHSRIQEHASSEDINLDSPQNSVINHKNSDGSCHKMMDVLSSTSKMPHSINTNENNKIKTRSNKNVSATTQYTEGMRFESGKSISEDTCQDNQNTNSPSSTNIDSNTSTNKLNIEPKSRSQIPSLLRFRSSSLSRDIDKVKPKKDYQVSETDKEPKAVTSSRNTPERSILSKFFRPGSVDRNTGETVKDTKEKKKSSGSTRRISRFLRPDFFDTPREESEYVKEKEAKKVADAEAKSKARKKKIVEKLEAARLENDVKKTSVDANAKRKDVSPKKEFEKGNKLHVNCKMETINSKDNIKNNSSKKDIKKLSNEDVEDSTHEEDSKSKPKGKNGGTKNDLFEKQNSTSNAKSRFFHSLEKKLEKFRSTGDDIPSATSGKSRVDKAIRSLRERSLGPRSSDLITTESNLIKRAVSADDCSIVPHTGNHLSKFNNASNSKLGSKVNSVLGLFRKLEDTPGAQLKKSQQRPKSMVINRVKRTQSMYTGSQSDGVLSSSIDDMLNDTPIPPLRLKRNSFGTCSDNDVKAPENLAGKEVTKKTKPFDKLTCSDARNDSSLTTIPPNKNNVSAQLSEGVQQKSESLGTVESKVSKIVKIDQCKSKSLKETLVSEEYLDKNLLQNVSFKSLPSGLTKGGGFKPMVNVGIKVDTTANIPKELLKAGNSKAIPRPTSLKGLTEIPLLNITTTDTANKIVNNVSGGSKIPQSNKHMLNKEWESGKMAPAIPSQSNPQSTNNSPNILPTEPNISPLNEFSLNDDEMKFAGMKKSDTLSYPADDSSSLLSPADESGSQSFDSWSVCSDVDGHEYPTSPIPVSGVSEDTEESVCDRIRRKSFYTRFNDIKRKNRKSSVPILSSSYLSSNVDPYSSHNSKKAHSSKVGSFQHEDIPSHDSFRADNDLPYGKKSPIPFKDYYVNSNGEHDNNFTMNSNNCNIPNGHVENVPSKLVENSQDMTVLETNNNVPERESSSQVLTDVYSKYVDGNAMNRLRSIPTHHTKSSEVGGYSYNPPDNSTSLYGGIPRTERRLSRPADFLKDSRRSLSMLPGLYSSLRVPTAWDGMSVSTGRLGSSLTPVGDYSNTLSRHRSAGGDASIHGKYNRYNSRSPTESPLLAGNLRENHWSERPTTPH